MSYRVKTNSFEGPFDVLLNLVSRKQVDIGSISIAQITDQYLDEIRYMSMVDLNIASDFLLVASTLLELKAASLVPEDQDQTEEEIEDLGPNEARELLIERLLEYKKFKNAASMLSSREESQSRQHARPFGPPADLMQGVVKDFLSGVSLERFAQLAAQVLSRRDAALLESEHIAAKPIPVEVHVRSLHYRIMNSKHLKLSEVLEDDAPIPIRVVTFLAILELYKRSMITIEQDEVFGDIDLSYIEGSGELIFDEEEDETENTCADQNMNEEEDEDVMHTDSAFMDFEESR